MTTGGSGLGMSPPTRRRGKCGRMNSRPNLAVPEIDGALYRWRFGDVSFEVDAQHGARITAFRIGTENMLTGPEVNPVNNGSTFWTSPQSDWNWPPVPEVDEGPYAVTGGSTPLFQSRPGGTLGIAVSKRFRVDPDRETVENRIRDGKSIGTTPYRGAVGDHSAAYRRLDVFPHR